jgi:hypothetical protein
MHVLPLSLCFLGHPADNSQIRQLTLYTEAPKFHLLTEVHQLYRFGGSMNLYIKKNSCLEQPRRYSRSKATGSGSQSPPIYSGRLHRRQSRPHRHDAVGSSPCSRVGHLLSSRFFRHPRGGGGGVTAAAWALLKAPPLLPQETVQHAAAVQHIGPRTAEGVSRRFDTAVSRQKVPNLVSAWITNF